jgi:hypothetical protein
LDKIQLISVFMGKRSYDKTSLEAARESLKALFSAYSKVTGIPVTAVSEIVADDRAFVYRVGKSSLSFSTYDRVVGRFSWIWPDAQAWPEGVARFAPIKPSDKAIAKIRDREEKQAAANTPPTLPGNAAWPSDIPAPGAMRSSR